MPKIKDSDLLITRNEFVINSFEIRTNAVFASERHTNINYNEVLKCVILAVFRRYLCNIINDIKSSVQIHEFHVSTSHKCI